MSDPVTARACRTAAYASSRAGTFLRGSIVPRNAIHGAPSGSVAAIRASSTSAVEGSWKTARSTPSGATRTSARMPVTTRAASDAVAALGTTTTGRLRSDRRLHQVKNVRFVRECHSGFEKKVASCRVTTEPPRQANGNV